MNDTIVVLKMKLLHSVSVITKWLSGRKCSFLFYSLGEEQIRGSEGTKGFQLADRLNRNMCGGVTANKRFRHFRDFRVFDLDF